jgi:SAM-dependent methyltransferase
MSTHAHTQQHDHTSDIVALLELDAEVMRDYLFEVTNWVRSLAQGRPQRRILDLGAGTGTGTMALASRFPRAQIVAVDLSADMLARVRDKAILWGFSDRVSAAQVDLGASWPEGAPADVIWAASSLHELPDPKTALRNAYAALNPGGLLAIVEMDAPPRFLPSGIGVGTPGFEDRLHTALTTAEGDFVPRPDWGPQLESIGFTMVEKRTFAIDLPSPQPASTGRFAAAYFRRIRPFVQPYLSMEDRLALDILLSDSDPRGLLHRPDLTVRASRTAWVSSRP